MSQKTLIEIKKPPRCVCCDTSMAFHRRLGLPGELIYRCEPCGTETWVPAGFQGTMERGLRDFTG
jgi:hypothetical protein